MKSWPSTRERPLEQVEAETERITATSRAPEAKEFGLVDDVLIKITDEKKAFIKARRLPSEPGRVKPPGVFASSKLRAATRPGSPVFAAFSYLSLARPPMDIAGPRLIGVPDMPLVPYVVERSGREERVFGHLQPAPQGPD